MKFVSNQERTSEIKRLSHRRNLFPVKNEALDADHLTPPKPSREENIKREVTPAVVNDASLQTGAPLLKKKRKFIAQVSISTVLFSHCYNFVYLFLLLMFETFHRTL